MSNLRVLILYDQLLLARAIEDALKNQDGLEVISVDGAQRDAQLKVKSLRPDVVVLDRHLPNQVPGTILDMCPDNGDTKFITIEHGRNDISVFRVLYKQFRADDPKDLIPIICSGDSPP